MPEVYKTGKAGNMTINSVVMNISKWSGKLTKEYADSTDSSGFDSGTQQLWKKQAAGAIQFEGSIEGFFDFDAGSSAVLAAVLGDTAYPVTFKYDETTVFASGLVNFMDFDTGIEVDGGTTVGFTTSFKSYGPMTIV